MTSSGHTSLPQNQVEGRVWGVGGGSGWWGVGGRAGGFLPIPSRRIRLLSEEEKQK